MNFPSHPLWNKTMPAKLAQSLWVHLTSKKYLVLVAPGSMFAPTDEIKNEQSWAYLRVCFAAVDEPDVKDLSRRFVKGVQDFWEKRSLDDIEEMGDAREPEASQGLADLVGGC